MEKTGKMESITRLSKHVIRVLGQNPGTFTLEGTNTYIIGTHNPYILVDTGEERETSQTAYISFLRTALTDSAWAPLTDATQPHISDIIISHWHHDHVGGLPAVLELLRELNDNEDYVPPRVHKFPLEPTDIPRRSTDLLPSLSSSITKELYTPTPDGELFHSLSDNQVFPVTSSPTSAREEIQVPHTPGHTPDSLALLLPFDSALYTADTILGRGTSVFDDLTSYTSTLERFISLGQDGKYTTIYPGHGPVISSPLGPKRAEMYLRNLKEREKMILELLSRPPPSEWPDGDEEWTTWTLVKNLYGSFPEAVWKPSAHIFEKHLEKMESVGVVERLGGEGYDTGWRLRKT